jgi:hypothetical protein
MEANYTVPFDVAAEGLGDMDLDQIGAVVYFLVRLRLVGFDLDLSGGRRLVDGAHVLRLPLPERLRDTFALTRKEPRAAKPGVSPEGASAEVSEFTRGYRVMCAIVPPPGTA